ncbi:DNA-directed RNA polymerase II subunit RPB1 [Carex littledalei]|uniref:DNA-directed RNA polymerase II subunit RPB1 n=1 Tax=Carex littledalei TaxID=544730 RepID=A0A833V8I7_9POAL|nr:DNA-directed RNA polymerase II subunit RPB1 [Carex littledalei]
MARSPAQSLKEKSGSPIARSDPKREGRELASDEMVLSGCYTKKDHGLKRARQDSEQRVWKYRPMSPDHCQEAHDYTPTGTGSTTRYVARYGGFALRTSFRSFTGCQYQEEKKFKRARQDNEQKIEEKTVEKELNSPECSPATCTEYWPYSSELSPTSPPYVPGWSYSPRSPEYRPRSPHHCQEAQDCTSTGTDSNIRAREDCEQKVDVKRVERELNSPEYWPYSFELSSTTPPYDPRCWSYSPTSPNHCQEAQGTGSNIRARRDSEQRIDEKGAEEELKSPEYSPNWLPNSP